MADFSVKVGIEFDTAPIEALRAQLANTKLEAKVSLDTAEAQKSLTNLINQINKTGSAMSEAFRNVNTGNSMTALSTELKSSVSQTQQLNSQMNQTRKSQTEINNLQRQITAQSSKLVNNIDTYVNKNSNLTDQYKEQLTAIQDQAKAIRDADTSTRNQDDLTNLKLLRQEYQSVTSEVDAFSSKLISVNDQTNGWATTTNQMQINFNAQVTKMTSSIDSFITKNTRLSEEYRTQLELLKEQANAATSTKELSGLNQQFQAVKNEAQAAGQVGNNFISSFSGIAKVTAQVFGFSTATMGAAKEIRNAWNEVVDMDSAMIELQKICEATSDEFNSFYYEANNMAKALGETTTEIINQTAEWARLGYSLEDATTLVNTSAIFENISPDMDIDQATEGLVSTIKAYGIEAEDALDGVVSKINIVGKRYRP